MDHAPTRRLWAIESLCNGCRNCEMMCSFFLTQSFQPRAARIRVDKDEARGIDRPLTDCNGLPCAGSRGPAACVPYCPTGALVFGTAADIELRKQELAQAQRINPEYMMAAPWIPRR